MEEEKRFLECSTGREQEVWLRRKGADEEVMLSIADWPIEEAQEDGGEFDGRNMLYCMAGREERAIYDAVLLVDGRRKGFKELPWTCCCEDRKPTLAPVFRVYCGRKCASLSATEMQVFQVGYRRAQMPLRCPHVRVAVWARGSTVYSGWERGPTNYSEPAEA
eukprot:1160060-Pelagomonas_calceolata.AAC.4